MTVGPPLLLQLLVGRVFLLQSFFNTILTVHAHPGGVANGRATCGTEYSTSATAYEIPDITEAWYLRRIATCDAPVFWTKFDITEANQPLYIAVISPEIERFEDQLDFHGILYGPGINGDDNSATSTTTSGLSPVPADLPPGIVPQDNLGGAGYLTSPPTLDTCDFVDTNPVMEQFSDVTNGRCMEKFTLGPTFSDPLQQDTTSWSWWLYSFNHRAAEPGTYYLQTWLTSPEDSTTVTVQGKYEITLGPWAWSGYASDTTLDRAQQQGTTCSCAVNALDYKENYLERLGDLDAQSYHVAALPGGRCRDGSNNNNNISTAIFSSTCVTTPQAPYISDKEAVEWSGQFTLEAGRTYEWTFHAYYQGTPNGFNNNYGYPDPGMLVVAVPLSDGEDVTSVAAAADATLSSVVLAQEEMDVPNTSIIVTSGETLDVSVNSVAQFVQFANTTVANSTTVLLQPTVDVRLAVFTQHVPSEFMAHVLRDADSGDYLFPTMTTLYAQNDDTSGGGEGDTTTEEENGGDDGAATENGGEETTAPVSAAAAMMRRFNFVALATTVVAAFAVSLNC